MRIADNPLLHVDNPNTCMCAHTHTHTHTGYITVSTSHAMYNPSMTVEVEKSLYTANNAIFFHDMA